MRAMLAEPSSEPSQFRVTLFVGPQPVEGKPFTYCTVFNVKKRSWKGGIQVAVDVTHDQVEFSSAALHFDRWLNHALSVTPAEDRASHEDRARDLFIQALSWCKLDLLLQSGIAQENQCLAADTWTEEFESTVSRRAEFITSYIATELDLPSSNTAPS